MSNTTSLDVEVSDSSQFTSSCAIPGLGQVVLIPCPGIMNFPPHLLQQPLTQNYFSGQSRTVYYKSNLTSPLLSQPPPISINHGEANNSRIVAMESTIKHLRELLQNEMKSKKKESDMLDSLKTELSELKEEKLLLENKLAQLEDEKDKEVCLLKKMQDEANCQLKSFTEELQVKQEQLEKLQQDYGKLKQELEGAANVNSKLETFNKLSGVKEEALKKQVEQLEKLNSSLEKSLLDKQSSKSAKEKELMEQESKIRMELEYLKNELDHVKILKENSDKLFKDLAKKHAFMIEYAGEQMYQEYTCQHNTFLQKLEACSKMSNSLSTKDLEGIRKTTECIKQQLAAISEYWASFKENVDRVTKRIDSGIALVSDLNFRAPSPPFVIPVEMFETTMEVMLSLKNLR